MVSKAKLDLPEPERPVTTMRLSRGISSAMFLRLCTRAPCTAIVVRAAAFGAAFLPFRFMAASEAIPWFPHVDKGEFLHVDVAFPREADGYRSLADQSLVGEVLA